MIKLIIDTKEYNLPTLMSEIPSKIGFELDRLLVEDYQGYKSLEYKKWVLAILCECDYDVINQVQDEQINIIVDNHIFFKTNYIFLSKYIVVNKKIYELIDYDSKDVIMTVEEYGEMDGLLNNPYENYQIIFKKLYRPVKLSIWKQIKIRMLLRGYKHIDDIPYLVIKNIIYNHIQWKIKLIKTYNLSAHDDRMSEGQQDEKYELNIIEKTFGFYHFLMIASGTDIRLADWWLNRDIKEMFQFINYKQLTSNM